MRLATGASSVLVIPDLQIPFHHKDTIPFLESVWNEMGGADEVVIIGDLVDHNAISSYAKDPDGMSAGDELKATLKYMQELYEAFPEATMVYGNHDKRIYRQAYNAGIPSAMIKNLKDILEAPDTWNFVDHIVIDDVRYEHGDRAGGMFAAKRLAVSNMQSTVIGHHHSTAGILYVANEDKMVFGMNAGCLCDMDSYAFNYARMYMTKPTMGCATVVNGIPQFHPLMIDKDNKWTK